MFKVERFEGNVSVAIFNNGYSRIIVDDGCWAIKNKGGNDIWRISGWIFGEALKILKQLPDNPKDYKPYTDFVYGVDNITKGDVVVSNLESFDVNSKTAIIVYVDTKRNSNHEKGLVAELKETLKRKFPTTPLVFVPEFVRLETIEVKADD